MATSDFSAEEWALVRQAPWLVTIGVMEAGGGGPFQRRREVGAVLRQVRATDEHGASSELVAAVAAELAQAGADEPLAAAEGLDAEHLMSGVLARSRTLGAILAQRAPPDEGAAFRTWLLALGRGVAEAATERAPGGRDGGPASPAELEFLEALAAALTPPG